MLRTDDFSKMKEMVVRLRKHRVNEARSGNDGGNGGGQSNTGGNAN